MTARTRLTLQQLDGRDLPSTVAVTVERPAEYDTASAEWQQAFDLGVQECLQGVVIDIALPDFEPAAAVAAPEPNGGRVLNEDEAREIASLLLRIQEIDNQLAQNQAARTKLRDQIGALTTTLRLLGDKLGDANDALTRANNQYDAFSQEHPFWRDDPRLVAQGESLLKAREVAYAYVRGIQDSIDVVANQITVAEQRIDDLNQRDTELRDIRVHLMQRLMDIKNAAERGVPSPRRPELPLVPATLVGSGFLDTRTTLPRPQ